jgi:UDP-N-acetylmuramoyl-L-alanyl-D-glutamate--2,6-diaminopimelate ligase
MGEVASRGADVAVVTSDNPRSEEPDAIVREVVAGAVTDVEVEPDRARAIGHALEIALPGDLVLVAGKGHEQGQEIAGRVFPFDDREVTREALRRLASRA